MIRCRILKKAILEEMRLVQDVHDSFQAEAKTGEDSSLPDSGSTTISTPIQQFLLTAEG